MMRSETIPYARQSIDEQDIAAVVDVLRSPWLTTGSKIAEFEQAVGNVHNPIGGPSASFGLHRLELQDLIDDLVLGSVEFDLDTIDQFLVDEHGQFNFGRLQQFFGLAFFESRQMMDKLLSQPFGTGRRPVL